MKKVLLALFLSFLFSLPILATAFTYTTIDVPNAGVTLTQAIGVNNSGQVVGKWQVSNVNHAFSYINGSFTEIIPPGAPQTVALGINNSAEIVGFTGVSTSTANFVDVSGTFSSITITGATSSQATGVTTCGQVVGIYLQGSTIKGFSQSCPPTPMLTTGIVAPSTPTLTTLSGVNDSGVIVGFANPSGVVKGFTLSAAVGGTFSSYYLAPGAATTNFAGVDSAGDIVGYYATTAGGPTHGFILIGGIGGTFQTIDDPDPSATQTKVFGISPNGKRIVGAWADGGGVTHGFVAVAVLPTVAIDTPTNGATVSGAVTVSGWALDNATAVGTAIGGVQVLVDGVPMGSATYGLSRSDVCAVYPGRPGCPNVGYTFSLNTASLSVGSHTLTVSATDTDVPPDTGSLSISIVVGNAPTVVSTVPSSGSGSFQNFALTVADASGASNIASVYFMVNTSVSASNSCFVSYNRAANTLYLMNDAGTTFQGPITPGTSGVVSNSQCTLSASGASVSTSGNNLTVNMPLGFAAGFSGAKNTFGLAQDNGSQYSPWTTTGTWTVTTTGPPAIVSTLPGSGSGSFQKFALTVTDGAGPSNIAAVYFLVNASISTTNSCLVAYNRAANFLYLLNDAGTIYQGPITPGTSGTVSNSQCTLSAAGASFSTSGNYLTLNLPLSFTFAYSGAKNTFGLAGDNGSQFSPWTTTGSWTVPASGPPAVVSTLPASGSGSFQTFSTTVADGGGPSNIASIYFLVNASISVTNSCVVSYNRAGNGLYLLNDAGTIYQGPITPGTSGTLSNSQCALSAAGASVSTSGSTLTLNLPLSFAFTFSGAKNTFVLAGDNGSVFSPWTTTGTWTVPASGPPSVVATSPASGTGSSQTFSITVSDGGGSSNIAAVYFVINASISTTNSCLVVYNNAANTLSLLNDAGTTYLGPITPGTATSLSNSQCTLSAASASISTSGTMLTVNLPLSFLAYHGAMNTFALVGDNGSLYSSWTTTGTWTIP